MKIKNLLIEDIMLSESEYSDKLKKNKYKVTSDEYVTHKHHLNAFVDLTKKLKQSVRSAYTNDIFTERELKQIQDAIRIIETSMVPIALLDVDDEKPKFKININKRH